MRKSENELRARATRRYERLLALLPTASRRELEGELLEVFRDAYRRRRPGTWALVTFWSRMLADLLLTAVAERRCERRRPMESRTDATAVDRRRSRLLTASELRLGARRLTRAPGHAALAVTTMALGIAATVIMLTLVRQVLLQPLPFGEPDRLVRLLEIGEQGGTAWPSFPNFADWRERATVFAGLAAVDSPQMRPVIVGETAVRVPVGRLSRSALETFGVDLAFGRPFAEDENRPGGPAVALVSMPFWRERLGGMPLEGLAVTVGPESFAVVGVMPAGFRFLGDAGAWQGADVWLPLERSGELGGRRSHGYHVVGRLQAEVSLDEARAVMDRLAAELVASIGEPTDAHTVRLTPLLDVVVGTARRPVQLLTLGAVLVLFVACFNLAAMLLVGGLARAHELGVRRALGAGRFDLVRQVLLESAMLAVPGAALGAGLAWLGIDLVRSRVPHALARLDALTVDLPALATAVGFALATALLAGLVPALVLSSPSRGDGFRSGRAATGSVAQQRLWRGFVAVQVALTMTLLVSSALLLRSFSEALAVDLGYEPESVLIADLPLPESRYAEPQRRVELLRRTLEQVRALPGVTAASVTNVLPHTDWAYVSGTARPDGGDEWLMAGYRVIDEGYFETLRLPWQQGQWPESPDGRRVVIDRTVADRLWGEDEPIGGELRNGFLSEAVTVAGVVGAVREWHMDYDQLGNVYVDYRSQPHTLLNMHLLVRTAGDPAELAPVLRATIASIDPMVPVALNTLAAHIGDSLAARRLMMVIAVAFAAVGLFLTALGVYGVVAFVTRRNTRELGIRIALGARPAQVWSRSLGHGLAPAVAGMAVGLLASVPVASALGSQLFGVPPHDPAAFAAAAVVALLSSLLAAWLPARSASRVDPVRVLRET